MKLATVVVLGILLLGSFASMQAAEPFNDSQVVMAFSGGSVYTHDAKGTSICLFYPVILGDLDMESLFSPVGGVPQVDKEHAYLVWISDYTLVLIPPFKIPGAIPGNLYEFLVPTAPATIYFRPDPENRHWGDLTDQSTWGTPVAQFSRRAAVFHSIDGGNSGNAVISSILLSSKPFKLNGKTYSFKDLMPHGMTCIEVGLVKGSTTGDDETGTCIAIGEKNERNER